jgi:capsid assembly protease
VIVGFALEEHTTMTGGIHLQAQSPGTAHADLGFWLQSQILGRPMAMIETHLDSLVNQLAANRFTLPRNRSTGARITERGTAIVEVHGVLINRFPVMGSFWGLNSYEGLAEQFRRLATNDDVKRVVLDIDSPGGMVLGIQACADALEALGDKKPVFAIAHDMAASAGYWIAAVAEELSVTPGACVGSIGVRAAHVSYAQMLDRSGIEVRNFRAGAAKLDGSLSQLLSDGEAAERQYEIDRDYDRFVAHVARNRPMSEDEVRATDARCSYGADAVADGLADRVETLEELVERVEKGAGKVKPARKSKKEPGSKAGLAPAERKPPAPAVPADDDVPVAGRSTGARRMSTLDADARATLSEVISQTVAALAAQRTPAPAAPVAPAAAAAAPAAPAAAAAAPAADAQSEKERIKAITTSDAGKANPDAAAVLAFETTLDAEMAVKVLDKLAAAKPATPAAGLDSALHKQMQKPGSAAGVKPDASGNDAAKPSLAAKIEKRFNPAKKRA